MSLRKETRDQKLKLALAKGLNLKRAAVDAGYGERTVHRRVKDPAFMNDVEKLRGQLFHKAVGVLSNGAAAAAEELVALLNDKSSMVRAKAADLILAHSVKLRDLSEMEQRLQSLEGQVKIYLPANGRETA